MKDAAPALLDLECLAIHDETPTIKTFRLLPACVPVGFEAGQALTLRVPLPSGPAWRTFTISDATEGALELTIKAQGPEGATRWLHDHFVPGGRLQARPPRGAFTLGLRSCDRLALVSAGSGATPMMAMLRALARTEPTADVVWLHAAHCPEEALFTAELTRLQAVMPNLRVAITVSHPQPGWFGLTGRISRARIAAVVPDFGRREVFCCGPEGFMTSARLIHAAEGGDKALFHTESFGATAQRAAPMPAAPAGDAATHRLNIAGRDLGIGLSETVLQASLRQGVIIPCGCGEGMCGTCMVRLQSGQVETTPNGGISAEEEAQGYILACSSRAVSDISVSLD